MVTCREIVTDLARIAVTLLSWGYALILGIFLLMKFGIGDRFWLIGGLGNFMPYCFIPLIVLVALSLALRSKAALITTVPLLLIGFLMFVGYFIPKRPAPATNPTIRITTINAYRSNRSLSSTINFITNINPDLVMMQEVPPNQVLPLLYRMSTIYPYESSRAGVDALSSNMLFSRYPILVTEDLQQLDSVHTQQRYVILYEGQQVSLYNIDLALPAGKSRLPLGGFLADFAFGYNDQARNEEIRRLLTRIAKETTPFLVAGDFGMTDQTSIYREVTRLMGDSFRETGIGLGGTWPVGEVEGIMPAFIPPLLRVDYIWHSSGFRTIEARLGSKIGSDHLPLYATLEVNFPLQP